MTKIMHVVGARPNFMKAAPVMSAITSATSFSQFLVHTGQHYDLEMSDIFFTDLGMAEPDANLEVGSGSHAWQTAEVMRRLEPLVTAEAPDWVAVYGDVNSTLAAALVCAKLEVPIAHVEAGLRSFDRSMPEEINRVLTDQLAHLLFTTEDDAAQNLMLEGIAPERIRFVGNVMIDSLIRVLPRARQSPLLHRLRLEGTPYVLVTLHRPANVDDPVALQTIACALERLSQDRAVIFPVHPRTREGLEQQGLMRRLKRCQLLPPVGYVDFLGLEQQARVVLTDSGGVQEETTFLRVPCLTLRDNTERPVTISQGTNRLVKLDIDTIVEAVENAIDRPRDLVAEPPALWDGHAGERIAIALSQTPT